MPQTCRILPTYLRCEYHRDPVGLDVTKPRLSWRLDPVRPKDRGLKQTAYQVLVASTPELLADEKGDLWDSKKVKSADTNQIEYAGKALRSEQACYWKVRVWDGEGEASDWSPPSTWTMGLLDPKDWQAEWIGYDAPGGEKEVEGQPLLPPPPYLRSEFNVEGTIAKATVYASAFGIYELHLNGERVGDAVFTPGWTDYRKRVYYQTYDVTDLVHSGENAMGAILADGWYSGYVGFAYKRDQYGGTPRFLAQLHIETEDGKTHVLATDGSWKATYGPILEADLQMGEYHDARKELSGWNEPGYNDNKWEKVLVGTDAGVALQAHPGELVRVTEEIHPVAITEPKPGVFVFDLAQNMVGWVRLKVQGRRGTKITLRFAERLNPDGTIYTTNLRRARATDYYILKGEGVEEWEPKFTFHGFQYVEITGYPGEPPLDTITGVVVHSDLTPTGGFQCNNEMLNQLYSNIMWGMRGNYLEAPTDCPQRDERLGWTGDAQVFIRTGTYCMDTASFFTKWLVDLEDTQSPRGALADVAPAMDGQNDSPAWTDAMIICPHTIYQVYNDTRILERHWPAMTKYMDFVRGLCEDGIRPAIGYGDWLHMNAETPREVIGTAYLAYMADLMAEMALAIGRKKEASDYEKLGQSTREAFNRAFVNDKVQVHGNTQTAYCLALAFDLLPEDKRAAAAEHLTQDIAYRGTHHSTGFVGTPLLLPVLEKTGHLDVAYRLLTNETFPSWGYPIRMGATTMWERWDSWSEERGFQTPSMNSFNHYAYGAVGEWMFGSVAGIDLKSPGYQHIRIAPKPGGGLDQVKADYDSIAGGIYTEWKLEDGRFLLNLRIPPNTTATVRVPTNNPDSVRESGKAIGKRGEVREVGREEDALLVEVGSGWYAFESVCIVP